LRVYAIVAACAAAAAGLTLGITLATRTTPPKPQREAGRPPLVLDFGVRTDPEAIELRRAADLYDRGQVRAAGLIFGRYRSVEAEVGAALAAWPGGFGEVSALARTLPRSSLVQLHYGLALYWRGEPDAAAEAWRTARRAQPDTPYSLRAEDLLYPNFPRGLPDFVPSFPSPGALDRLSPPMQLAFLKGQARSGGVREKLLYGVALQRLDRQLSALREFEEAARLDPADPEPKVAVAVARFDKADPSRTFSQLGPLASRYPRSQSVRFHLGLCLIWLGNVKEAKRQLGLARALGAGTPLGKESRQFLERLAKVGSG
jgi:tetratricopeptide (TPR) repeat protein